jgi:beta-glucosidase
MPGPHGPWGDALVAAVRDGHLSEAVVDDKVRRLLLLAARVGRLQGTARSTSDVPPPEHGPAFARHVAVEGSVLLTNGGVLPLDGERLDVVAVIGHNAVRARTQGGGSATVLPDRVVSPLEGIRAALPTTRVEHALGAVVQQGVAGLPEQEIRLPGTDLPGALVTFHGADGSLLHREHRRSTDLVWFGGDAPVLTAAELRLAFTWTPTRTGPVRLGFASGGFGRVMVDGREIVAGQGEPQGQQRGASPLAPPSVSGQLAVVAGEPREVTVSLRLRREAMGQAGLLAIRVGTEPDEVPPPELVAEAVELASGADVAVVVVGTNADVESEGFDRSTLDLPGAQDELVRAVAATGTPTVVVVNSGAPVLLPWRDEVAAILVSSFGGQEMGHALADVLLGRHEPGGRLPTTWPGEEPPPVLDVTPVDGRLEYVEGVHVGHRAWLRAGRAPAFAFGHGLGYTTWELGDLEVEAPDEERDGRVSTTVHNTGPRPGKQVVQVYLSRTGTDVDHPDLWLAAHGVVRCDPGKQESLTLPLPWRAFAHWADGWCVEGGRFDVHVGTSSADLPLRGHLVVEASRATAQRSQPPSLSGRESGRDTSSTPL